jgi:hypothetical protein
VILTPVITKSSIIWDIPSCSPLNVKWNFGGQWRLHLQVWRISQARNLSEAGSKLTALNGPHSVIYQKIQLFLLNCMWTYLSYLFTQTNPNLIANVTHYWKSKQHSINMNHRWTWIEYVSKINAVCRASIAVTAGTMCCHKVLLVCYPYYYYYKVFLAKIYSHRCNFSVDATLPLTATKSSGKKEIIDLRI